MSQGLSRGKVSHLGEPRDLAGECRAGGRARECCNSQLDFVPKERKKNNHSRFLKQVTSRAGSTDQLLEEKSNERKATTQEDQMQGSLMQRRAQ